MAGRSWVAGLGEALEEDLGMGNQLVAFGHHKEAAADAEVADMTTGGGAWGIEAGGIVAVVTSKTPEVLRSLFWL